MVDMTERRHAEREREQLLHRLTMFNSELEERVRSRTSELSAALREVMLQEIHHRVKNNLQVIASLINMQMRSLDDVASKVALEECSRASGRTSCGWQSVTTAWACQSRSTSASRAQSGCSSSRPWRTTHCNARGLERRWSCVRADVRDRSGSISGFRCVSRLAFLGPFTTQREHAEI
jgi:hypothetical protein